MQAVGLTAFPGLDLHQSCAHQHALGDSELYITPGLSMPNGIQLIQALQGLYADEGAASTPNRPAPPQQQQRPLGHVQRPHTAATAAAAGAGGGESTPKRSCMEEDCNAVTVEQVSWGVQGRRELHRQQQQQPAGLHGMRSARKQPRQQQQGRQQQRLLQATVGGHQSAQACKMTMG